MKKLSPLIWFLILSAAVPAAGEFFQLDSVRMENVPRVQKTTASYAIEFYFSPCPAEYWVYYDTLHQSIVIDFYNATIEPRSLAFGRSDVFKGISIKNLKTEFSLSGERSQISIGADPGWHLEVVPTGTTALRLTAWRQLHRDRLGRNLWVWTYILAFAIPIVVGIGTFLIISSASN
jgi:hypothetical protein